jgi:peroxiredoxin-like protein
MSEHHASLRWERGGTAFTYPAYSRDHQVVLGPGTRIEASSAKEFGGTPERANPEEMLVGAASSCHMLTLLAICAREGLVVDGYEDQAVGWLEKDERGHLSITRIVLRPRIRFAEGSPVDASRLASLHERAHRGCFIANSIRTAVTVEQTRS